MSTISGCISQDETANVVDCDLLEAAKENVQPLASGRRVTALSTILATPHAQRESKLAATRHRLRINVEIALEDEEDNPLEAYCSLVYWTIENYPQGHSAESGVLELLEEATRVLKDDRGGVWKSEEKYLKLWVLYASFVERQADIYSFLNANEIGTAFSLLYEEWGTVLERDGRRAEADRVYLLGVARQAAPLERLKMKHNEFQKRMMLATPLATSHPSESSAALRRTALATTSTSRLLPSLSGPNNISSVTTTSTSRPTSNARLPIFVDPSGSASQAAELASNTWSQLGTRKAKIKENVPETKKMVGSVVKQAGRSSRIVSASSASTEAKIVPYRDPEQTSGEASESSPTVSSLTAFNASTEEELVASKSKFTPFSDEDALSVMKAKDVKIEGSSQSEALRKDPLKNHKVPF